MVIKDSTGRLAEVYAYHAGDDTNCSFFCEGVYLGTDLEVPDVELEWMTDNHQAKLLTDFLNRAEAERQNPAFFAPDDSGGFYD